jgi:putative DNA primase/helicase
MRICKNILLTFKLDENNYKMVTQIIHEFMKNTPEKYNEAEIDSFLTKIDDDDENLKLNKVSWGSLAAMSKLDNSKHYNKIFRLACDIAKADIFNVHRLKSLMDSPRKYYWADYGEFDNAKFTEPDTILKYLIDTVYKVMNGGRPYYITMNKSFKEYNRHGEIVFDYKYKTLNQNPFKDLNGYCVFQIGDDTYDMVKFSNEFFKHQHYMSAEMLPYAGLNDPFKRFINNNYKIINLFEGFGMAKFKCRNIDVNPTYSLMLYHIKSIICDNDITLYNYVIGWLAFIIQNPEIKHETCLLLQGIEGCGKNKFVEIVKRILGENLCFDTYNIDDIIGGFNSQLSGKLLVIGDELVGYAGFKKSDFIKGMLTSPNISITKKGVDTIAEKSFQRYIFTTNNEETLRISNNDRRICIIGVSSSKVCDFQYFKALTVEMDELDNIKGLFDYLNTYDLSTYDFRKAPKTALKTETINNQLDDIYHWFIDYADSCGTTRKKEFSITSKEAYDSYSDYAGKNTRRKDFNTKMLKLLKCEYKKRNTGRCYVFDIDKTNELFMKLYDNKKIILIREIECETENIPVIYATEDDNIPVIYSYDYNATNDLFSDDDDEK